MTEKMNEVFPYIFPLLYVRCLKTEKLLNTSCGRGSDKDEKAVNGFKTIFTIHFNKFLFEHTIYVIQVYFALLFLPNTLCFIRCE